MNPYSGNSFLEFFYTLFRRLLVFEPLVADEIQVLVLISIAISGALVGTYLILRKMAMLANSLSHTILIGIVIAYLITSTVHIPAMLLAALLTGLATTFLTQFFSQTVRLQEDASTGLVFTTLFALGIVLITLYTRNAHIGVEVVTGNPDALNFKDLALVALILKLNLTLFGVFYRPYHITTFDPSFARSLGYSTTLFNYLLMMQTSLTAIAGFRAVGVLMVLAFIAGPPLAARMLTKSLFTMLLVASMIGSLAALLGVATTRHFLSVYDIPLSTAGVTVCWIVILYLLAAVIALRTRQPVPSSDKIHP